MELSEREQVIKDLQKIVDSYSGSWKMFDVLDGALALIKELVEENEELKAKLHRIVEQDIPVLVVEEIMNTHTSAIMKDAYDIAVRNMKSKLTDVSEFALRASDNGGIYYVDHAVWIDDVAKEMLEEK